MKPGIERLDGDTVHFADGSSEHVDLLVYATGYRVALPFFDPDLYDPAGNAMPLYERVLTPELPGLFFIGFIQTVGSNIPLMEFQSEWAGDLITGACVLPPEADMPSLDRRRPGRTDQALRALGAAHDPGRLLALRPRAEGVPQAHAADSRRDGAGGDRRCCPRSGHRVQAIADLPEIPLARPVLGEAEERAVIDVLRSGQLSLGPRVPAFEHAFAARIGAPHASAVSSGTAGLHLALRAAGVSDGDEVVTSPFSFVASANACLFERARPVFADIDAPTLNLDPRAAAAAVTDHTAALLPVHIFGYPADLPAFEPLGLPIVEDACEALGAVHADGTAVGGRGHPAVFGFYANKQLTTGEGGMVTAADAAVKEQIDSERNQGRAPDMGWLDHDRLGFNYRLSDVAARSASCSWSGSTGCSPPGRASPGATGRRSPASTGSTCPARTRRRPPRLVRLRRPGPARRRSRRRRPGLRERGVQSKPYLPAIHLMSFYRERFGHREGEFPVCEDVAARSLALPFFPQMTEGQVGRVAAALRARRRGRRGEEGEEVGERECLRGEWREGGGSAARLDSPPMSRFAEPQDPDFASINRSLDFDRRLWPYDVAQSRAHARMLAARGIISDAERDALLAGLDAVEAELRGGTSRSARTTRTSTWRSSAA